MKDVYIAGTRPLANPANCIQGDCYRITLLTEKLVRLEYAADGKFEDGATQTVWNRDFPPVPYTLSRRSGGIVISTARLQLVYDEQAFSPGGLSICLRGCTTTNHSTWHYGDPIRDLKGTARTLDEVNGSDVELGPGLISRDGFSVLDDSRSLVLTADGWVRPRLPGIQDLYFFGYGHDYLEALQDFYRLCGAVPMLPRFALGNWWSRYYPYSEESYLALMDRFEAEEIPLSVAVVDMDWHLVDIDPKYGNGWTGFTWNPALFPDPRQFLDNLHRRGLKVTLNLHPADGIRAHERAYPVLAAHMAVDAAGEEPVFFEPGDPDFLQHYYEDVLHPLEDEGVDFWWMDWQQGTHCKIPGLDPLWILNHYDFLDSGRDGRRPLTLSRYAGPGSHRYPVGFSGDTVISWETLRFQPYFTATASNIGYSWWSHDIGGHMLGCKDDELMARWTQLGVFSPILRLHSSCSVFHSKEPWRYKPEAARAITQALRLRHRMLPYLYTMNRRSCAEGIPLVLPLYYLHPEQPEAYRHPNEYYFGSSLLVLPITSPRIPGLNVAGETLYLPQGLWYDLFTHRAYHGGRTLRVYRPLEQTPAFAQAGTILPLTDEPAAGQNPGQLHICIFLGAGGAFDLYEDDNETTAYTRGEYAVTPMELADDGSATQFRIRPARGQTSLLPQQRRYVLDFIGCQDGLGRPEVSCGGQAVPAQTAYFPEEKMLRVSIDGADVQSELAVCFDSSAAQPENQVDREVFAFLDQAEIPFIQKERIYRAVTGQAEPARQLAELQAMGLDTELYGALAELLTAY